MINFSKYIYLKNDYKMSLKKKLETKSKSQVNYNNKCQVVFLKLFSKSTRS